MGPSRVLFLDEISTGLDSSTTHQIINYLRHTTHSLDGTTLVSLLQPDPETYEMFDDVILFSEGQIVYQGPCEAAVDFFTFMGFKCPSRKNVADYLQEVLILSFPLETVPVDSLLQNLHFNLMHRSYLKRIKSSIGSRTKGTHMYLWRSL